MLLSCGLLAACSRDKDEVAPASTIAGAIPPVAGIGSALSVRVTAADGTSYSATPDPQTGNFSLPVPAGTYTLTFVTTLSTPNSFPARIPVTVLAGGTATPTLPPLTHDNVVRGRMRWTINGTSYAASWLNGQFSDRGIYSASKGYLYLYGQAGKLDTSPTVTSVFLVLPEASRNGMIFTGPGTYPLGGDDSGSFAEYTDYVGGKQSGYTRYSTPYYLTAPTGTLHLTRYNYELGVAAGTFEFTAPASANTTGQRTITQGEFDITF
jgi:hypothetical protein